MKAKKNMMVGLLCLLLLCTPASPATTITAVPIIGLIKDAVAMVIKAIDLRIQRLQNKTIWLQNAQKQLENVLSKVKLDEISTWTQKQKELYKEYYDELAKVKSIITYYQRIRDITQKQIRLVAEYERAWKLFQRDDYFKIEELAYMQKVYSGILNESMKNIDQIFSVIDAFTLQMSDAKRLEIINTAADQIDETYDDLSRFNRQNMQLSIQRAKSINDVNAVKKFYGILN
jgi:methyl-accepting chemotaxis protein